MIQHNTVTIEGVNTFLTVKFFFTGSTALTKGMGLCYDRVYYSSATGEAVTNSFADRCKKVALPSQSNNLSFAGVVSKDYAAVTGGQYVEIYVPGSVCDVLSVDSATTIGHNNFLWCIAGGTNAGKWTAVTPGFSGKGQAKVMQTTSATGTVLVELIDGDQESGLVEIIPTATLTAGGAITCMVGGTTYFDGPATPASDCTFTLANGTFIGQQKAFDLDGALTTNDVQITVTTGYYTSGVTNTGFTGLEFDADNDFSLLRWSGAAWQLVFNLGPTVS